MRADACLIGSAAAANLPHSAKSAAKSDLSANEQFASEADSLDELILPASYEQYLPLNKPTGIAVSDNYTAISDGTKIYLYDRAENIYHLYTHATSNNLTKLQFSANGTLYFSDTSLHLYTLDPETEERTETNISCSTFTLYTSGGADVIYFSTVSGNRVQIYREDNTHPLISELTSTTNPAIAADESGALYYTSPSGDILYRTGETAGAERPYAYLPHKDNISTPVRSVALLGNVVYYTDEYGIFYAYNVYDLKNLDTADAAVPICTDEGGYSALTVYNNNVYAVKNNSVRQYSPALKRFVDYEISASSSSPSRLSGANDVFLCDDLLLTADAENSRISVYDTKNGAQKTLSLPFRPEFTASDGETFLAANKTEAAICRLSDGELLSRFQSFTGNIAGVTEVYGTYYLITDENGYYKISPVVDAPAESEEAAEENPRALWTMQSIQKRTSSSPSLISSDVYGKLYISIGGEVYRLEETEFLNADAEGKKITTVHAQSQKIAVDYDQTVYSLYNNEIVTYKNSQILEKYRFDETPVYSEGETPKLTSFAFGVEEKATYLLYNGNYIVRSYSLPLPTVKTIPVNKADEEIFAEKNAVFSMVNISENALCVSFDLTALKDAEIFPYIGFSRMEKATSALKLGETDDYNILAIYNADTKDYDTAIVKKEGCTTLPETDYLLPSEGYKEDTGYLTNRITVYKYPYLTELLTVDLAKKNEKVRVLGEIDAPDRRYCYISYLNEDGEEVRGYLPKAYVSNFDGEPPATTTKRYGALGTDKDAIWRMVYLILGSASICVLIDYLILRKKKQ